MIKFFSPQTVLLFTLFLVQGCKNIAHSPDHYFSKEQQVAIIKQSVRYSTQLAPGASHETKFNSEFDEYYDIATTEYDIRACFPEQDNGYYFLMTRKARSIWPAREAIGGKLKVDKDNKLLDYEEVFRTWKMTEDTLNTRAFELFDLMVKGKDLTLFKTKYKGDRYIEFPDDRFSFDKGTKRWRDNELDSLKIN